MTMIRSADRLRHFLAVAREGNLNAAARQLGLSQPALTKHIRKLENELGVELFTRHPRGMSLTQLGERLLRHAKLVEAELRFAEAEIRSVQHGHSGVLRVGAGPFWGVAFVPQALARLQKDFPDLRIELEVGVNTVTHPKLFRGDLDIVFSSSPNSEDMPSFIQFQDLLHVSMRICSGRRHPLARAKSIATGDLTQYPWVEYQDDPDTTSNVQALFRAQRCAPPRYAIRASSMLAVVQLLKSGPYLGCLAGPLLAAASGLGLVVLPFRREIRTFASGALCHRAIAEMVPVRSLISYLAADASRLKAS
jgi:DNA-binding transcriptional LysR family regulator